MSSHAAQEEEWQPELPAAALNGPIYLAIADRLAADIAAGRLRPGQRLPPHRSLAEALGVDLTTVTRAYNEARRRGLIEAGVGRGTFVRAAMPQPGTVEPLVRSPAVDLGMNLPSLPSDAAFGARFVAGVATLQTRPDFLALLTYRSQAGSEEDRAAAVAWLRPLLPGLPPERVLVVAGIQAGLVALMTTCLEPGDTVVTEQLTYQRFIALAGQLRIGLAGVPVDGEGLIPEALERACLKHRPKALYCVPTIHNPTTATMSPARRQAVAAIARKYGLAVFEDDAYGLLPQQPLAPLAALLPEKGFYLSGLAKFIAPGLRIAYLVAPDAAQAARIAAAVRATTVMAAPLMAALATQWINDGSAVAIRDAIRRESMARQKIAARILPIGAVAAHPQGHHVWLDLPPAWTAGQYAAYAQSIGLAAVPGEVFAVGKVARNGVRLALGAAETRESLEASLRLAAAAIDQPPAILSTFL